MEMRLSQFGPSLAWLLSRDVPASRLAEIFNTTPENVRVIAFRARHAAPGTESDVTQLAVAPSAEFPASAGVRAGPDDVVRTPAKTRNLEKIKSEIDRTVEIYSAQYAFPEGARALRRILPKIGFAGDARRIALAALLHQNIAWFLVHGGQSESAARESALARDLWRFAFHETGDRAYADSYIHSALIGSNALLLTRQPKQSWQLLDAARDAAHAISAATGSELLRQRGVALFLLREDEQAVVHFRMAAESMRRLGEAKNPAHLLMTGSRHTSLAELNWESAQEVFDAARQGFGERSLESAMALHWAIACGLSTDSQAANAEALELIEAGATPADQFGHQLTIRRLLAITPELGFDLRLRRAWLRRTLYENAFRGR
jgi:hypothetical protein